MIFGNKINKVNEMKAVLENKEIEGKPNFFQNRLFFDFWHNRWKY